MIPGFNAEATLHRPARPHSNSRDSHSRHSENTVVPAVFPLGCYIGEYVQCLQSGAPSSACDDFAAKTCLGRILGADI